MSNPANPFTTGVNPDDWNVSLKTSSVLEKRVLETWLAENGEGFELDDKQLVALQTSGVPSTVIDMFSDVSLALDSKVFVSFDLGSTWKVRESAGAMNAKGSAVESRIGTRRE